MLSVVLPWSLYHRAFAYDTNVKNSESRVRVWGFLKSRVYAAKLRTLGELKTAIRENIQQIGEETLVKVEANFRNRLQICAPENGHHLSDIVFRS